MEIVHNDDILREEILKDAEKKAERILKKVKREVDELHKKNDDFLSSLKSEYESQYNQDTEEKVNVINASIDIELNKLKIKYCGDLVNKVFYNVAANITKNEFINYEDLILNIILKSMERINSDELVVEINSNELSRVSKAKILKLKNNKKIIKTVETNDNVDGIVIYSKDKKLAVYISITKYLENFKNQYRTMIYNILTGDINE